ncbi:MAG: nickel-responsive transcriptional regulator NikR [Longimicrobiales bacterium]
MIRFGVSMEAELLERFDEVIARRGRANRSEAFRDLVRERLVEERVSDPDAAVLGVLTLVYDHHRRELQDRLMALQHDHLELVITTMHLHVSHDTCLEVLLLRGRAGPLRELATTLAGYRGVHHSHLTLTAVLPEEETS